MHADKSAYSIKNPFVGTFVKSQALCPAGSGKDTRHIQIAIPASELPFTVGESLCIVPDNHPDLVAALLEQLPCAATEMVNAPNGSACTLREALLSHCTISKISNKCFKWYAALSGDAALQAIAEDKEQMKAYLDGRDVLDLVTAYPVAAFPAQDLVDKLGKIIPRLYSIASSQKLIDDKIELTIAMVEWDSHERLRYGVASTYLGHRCQPGDQVRCYIHHAKKFKLPADTSIDVIMVGPGTGIAPFRAFMQDRVADKASGRNWVYFGDWRKADNYYYESEWQAYIDAGQLQHLDVAFSRDQEHKIYVQHLLEQNAEETWAWIDGGAHFYVCGDASRMAKDVDDALHALIAKQGAKGEAGAKAYVEAMIESGRYQRDVY